MAQTGAVVHVVGAEQRPEHFLQQVVVFVGGLGAAVDSHGIRAIAFVDFHQSVGDDSRELIPGGFAPFDRAGSKAWVAFARIQSAAFLQRIAPESGSRASGW